MPRVDAGARSRLRRAHQHGHEVRAPDAVVDLDRVRADEIVDVLDREATIAREDADYLEHLARGAATRLVTQTTRGVELDAGHPEIIRKVGRGAAALVPVTDRLLRFPIAA